jgi:hypothetical protein
MSSSKQVAAAVIIPDECGVFGRRRREMWAKNWLLDRGRFTHLNLLNFGRLERILTMVYVVQSYWACFGLYPSSCMWETKDHNVSETDLSLSSGAWGRINLLSWAR